MEKLLTLLFLVVAAQLFSQTCGADNTHLYKMQTDSVYRSGYLKKESWETKFYSNEKGLKLKTQLSDCDNLLIVPVVVHIINVGEAIGQGSNITDTRVNNAINYANTLLANNFLGDTKIKLQLAKVSPEGNPTTGIIRVNGSSVPDYSTLGIQISGSQGANEQAVKDLSRWPSDKYYNVWVVNKIYNNYAFGYASLPTFVHPYDGVVINYGHMNSNKETLVHEFGHSLNLYHTFEGLQSQDGCPVNNNCLYDGDRVCDTPPHTSFGCDVVNPCDTSDSYNCRYNLMSYCTNRFILTPGQIRRMRDALINLRPQLYNNNNLIGQTDTNEISISRLAEDTIRVFPSAGYNTIHFNAHNWGSNTITGFNVRIYINTTLVKDKNIALNLLPGTTEEIAIDSILYEFGDNQVQITLSNPNNQLNEVYANNNTICYGVKYIETQTEGEQCIDFKDKFSLSSFYNDGATYIGNSMYYTDFLNFKSSTCPAMGDSVTQFPAFLGYFGYGGFLNMPWQAYNLYSHTIDLSNAENAYFKFDLFHQKPEYSKTQMEVEISASTDNGLNWESIFKKNDFIQDATIDGYLYTPTTNPLYTTINSSDINSCNAWRTDSVNLSAFTGQKINLKYSFRKFISVDTTYGKYLYLDNFCITICEVGECLTSYKPFANSNSLTIYPNPANSILTIQSTAQNNKGAILRLFDISGREVYNKIIQSVGGFTEQITMSGLVPGVYILSVTDTQTGFAQTHKIVRID